MPVLVTFDFPPAFGGLQRYCARVAEALAELGYAVTVVAPDQPDAAAYDRTLRARVMRFGGKWRPLRIATAWLQAVGAHRHVSDKATIATTWFPSGLVGALLPRRIRGNFTVLAHGSELAAKRGSLRERVRRAVFKSADQIIAVSHFTAGRLRQINVCGNVVVIPCGVDTVAFVRRPAAIPTILFVGRLVPRKGCDRLIAALATVKRLLPNVRLEVIGDGPDRSRLVDLAARAGVTGSIDFLGAVSDDERNAAFERAWCFAMPVRVEGNDVEGFGIVYLEAAMAGIPAIGGKGSGAEDAIVEGVTGFLVDGNDEAAISDALVALLNNPQRAEAMGAASRERASSQYTWSHIARSIAAAIGLPPA